MDSINSRGAGDGKEEVYIDGLKYCLFHPVPTKQRELFKNTISKITLQEYTAKSMDVDAVHVAGKTGRIDITTRR